MSSFLKPNPLSLNIEFVYIQIYKNFYVCRPPKQTKNRLLEHIKRLKITLSKEKTL